MERKAFIGSWDPLNIFDRDILALPGSPAEVEADEKRAKLQARKEDAAIQMQA